MGIEKYSDTGIIRRLFFQARLYWTHVARIFLIGLLAMPFFHSLGSYMLQTYTGERMTLNFRESLFRQVQRLSFSFHDTQRTDISM